MAEQSGYGAVGEDVSGVGTVTWASPGNVTAEDSTPASCTLFGEQTHYLVARGFNFSLPVDAVITAIEVTVRRASSGKTRDVVVTLWRDGAPIGTNQGNVGIDWLEPGYWSHTYDDPDWGVGSLDYTTVNAASFGVAMSVDDDGAGSIPSVDSVFMQIVYTTADDPSGPVLVETGLASSFTRRKIVPQDWPSIGADDSIDFLDMPADVPLGGPTTLQQALPLRRTPVEASFVTTLADNLDNELASLDAVATLLCCELPQPPRRPAPLWVTTEPPPDESHPCGCVGTAKVVSYGFATASFVGGETQAAGGGTFAAKLIETGYTASLGDACDCEE